MSVFQLNLTDVGSILLHGCDQSYCLSLINATENRSLISILNINLRLKNFTSTTEWQKESMLAKVKLQINKRYRQRKCYITCQKDQLYLYYRNHINILDLITSKPQFSSQCFVKFYFSRKHYIVSQLGLMQLQRLWKVSKCVGVPCVTNFLSHYHALEIDIR